MNSTVFKIVDINIEKIWGLKKIDDKIIGEIVKFEINEERSNIAIDNHGNEYSLYDLYSSSKRETYFGEKYANTEKFPFLIKYIYSAQKLSVQVHPKEKKETWLSLKDNGKIMLGLKEGLSKDNLAVDTLLNNSNVLEMSKYSFAVVEPGTIHSILEDNAICEVQNNCDITYRYYDWDNNRKLTQEEFIDSATFDKFDVEKNTWREFSSYNSANFDMQKYSIKGEIGFSKVDYCQIIIVLEGTGLLKVGDESIEINSEESLLIIPNIDYSISGDLNILVIS